jgi:uncharacterized protein YbjT (DUF2867 family)
MIVITGATGNVGSKLTEKLLADGQKLRLIARHRDKLEPYEKKGAEVAAGSVLDTDFLTKAYSGARAVLTMMPADLSAEDIGAYQKQTAESIFAAVRDSGVKHVVNLSSLGGHTSEGTGIVAGLARLESMLNELSGVNILHLRPGYFMENLLGYAGMIKGMGVMGGEILPDTRMSLVATKDVAAVAAEQLTRLDFTGHSVLPIMGSRDYTMSEVAKVFGTAIGKLDLQYVAVPSDQVIGGLMQMGASESVAKSFIELGDAINNGTMSVDKRTPESTTPTTIEEFSSLFAGVYQAA